MVDLFVSLEELPQEVQDILQKYYEIFESSYCVSSSDF